jgi:hypothetical protein
MAVDEHGRALAPVHAARAHPDRDGTVMPSGVRRDVAALH